MSPKSNSITLQGSFDFIIRIGLWLSGLFFALVVLSQVYTVGKNGSYGVVLLALIIGLAVYFLSKVKNTYLKLGIGGILIVLGVCFRAYVIYYFNTPLIVEPLYSYQYAKQWINGPVNTPHAIIWNSWGVYALFLKSYMRVLGTSILQVKMLTVVLALLAAASIAIAAKVKNSDLWLPALFVVFLYPAYSLYSNFPGCDLFFVAVISVALSILSWASLKENTPRGYIISSAIFVLLLAFANIFKEISIITIPLTLFLAFYELVKHKKIRWVLPAIIFILIVFYLVPKPFYSRVEYYAKGPIDNTKIGYYLATGLNTQTEGLFVSRYYYNFYNAMVTLQDQGKLTRESYKMADKGLLETAKFEAKDYTALPRLFSIKFMKFWRSDREINRMSLYDSTLYELKAAPAVFTERNMLMISDGFYLVITVLFLANIYGSLKGNDFSALNLFTIFFTLLFALSLIIIESQPRYKVIMFPTLFLGAIFGLEKVTAHVGAFKKGLFRSTNES